jgi:hypothetical protein
MLIRQFHLLGKERDCLYCEKWSSILQILRLDFKAVASDNCRGGSAEPLLDKTAIEWVYSLYVYAYHDHSCQNRY